MDHFLRTRKEFMACWYGKPSELDLPIWFVMLNARTNDSTFFTPLYFVNENPQLAFDEALAYLVSATLSEN